MIHTIARLHAVKPGECITYYRGDIDHDIAESDDSPRYQDLLISLKQAAITLERAGLIKLSKHKFWASKLNRQRVLEHFWVDEHMAIGVWPGRKMDND